MTRADLWPALVGDIGGTNARFGMVAEPGATVAAVEQLTCGDFPSLEKAVEAYLDGVGGERPKAACLAVAGPVTGDRVRFSNRGWDVSKRQLADSFGLEKAILINDFEALAHSLPELKAEQMEQLGSGLPLERAPKVVVGPGTGLGVAALVPCGDDWTAVSGEGGHVDLAAVEDLEIEVLKVVRGERGRVSAESLLSGPGLKRLYRALCTLQDLPPLPLEPEQIGDYALSGGDARHRLLCRNAAELFVSLFASFAGNLALTYGARGGVYIGGGVMGKLREFYSDLSFRQRFEAKGRMSDFLRAIPCFLITADTPALTGAARCLGR
ncbi:MAG: glucokinase [Limibacillus sp.]